MKQFTFALLLATTICSTYAVSISDKNTFNSGKLGDLLSGIQSTIENATASTEFSIEELTGTWIYKLPGIQFESDNSLQKIGGSAAAITIENKLAPYYSKAGLNQMTITFDAKQNFTIKLKYGTLKGSIEKGQSGKLCFNFQAFGKIKLGKVNCMATKSGSLLNLTFDAKRFIEIMQKVASISNKSSLQSIADMLASYDGIYVGVKLSKK